MILSVETRAPRDPELTGQLSPHTVVGDCEVCELSDGTRTIHSGTVTVPAQEIAIRVFRYRESSSVRFEAAYTEWDLPSAHFRTYWDSIVYDEAAKHRCVNVLLRAEAVASRASLRNLVPANKTILLGGPPGCGKSTLCRAIAQKLAIRSGEQKMLRAVHFPLLFSRFYGETPRALSAALDAPPGTVVILDEVESILGARESLVISGEPRDSLRTANALLAAIDESKLIFLLTTNFPDRLDSALIDRCDHILHMGPPSQSAVYKILSTIFESLFSEGFLLSKPLCDFHTASTLGDLADRTSVSLVELSAALVGASGRSIKKRVLGLLAAGPEPCDSLIARMLGECNATSM